MSEEEKGGFFSQLARGVLNICHGVWNGIKYVGVGLAQVVGGAFGFGPGMSSGLDKVLSGTQNLCVDTVFSGVESITGMQNNQFNDLSILLRQNSPAEIKKMCDKDPNLTASLFDNALWDNDTVSLLRFIETGVNLNINTYNKTPLSNAIQRGNVEIVEAMLKQGAKPNFSKREFPNGTVSADSNYEMAKILLNYGADINSPALRYLSGNEKVRQLLNASQQNASSGLVGTLSANAQHYNENDNLHSLNNNYTH